MDFLNISIGFYYSLKKSQISNSNEFPLGKTSNLKEILLRPDTARISFFFSPRLNSIMVHFYLVTFSFFGTIYVISCIDFEQTVCTFMKIFFSVSFCVLQLKFGVLH